MGKITPTCILDCGAEYVFAEPRVITPPSAYRRSSCCYRTPCRSISWPQHSGRSAQLWVPAHPGSTVVVLVPLLRSAFPQLSLTYCTEVTAGQGQCIIKPIACCARFVQAICLIVTCDDGPESVIVFNATDGGGQAASKRRRLLAPVQLKRPESSCPECHLRPPSIGQRRSRRLADLPEVAFSIPPNTDDNSTTQAEKAAARINSMASEVGRGRALADLCRLLSLYVPNRRER